MRILRETLLLLSATGVSLLTSCSAIHSGSPQTGGPGPGTDKSTPVITWAQPAPISTATPLGSQQLNATANVAGTFAYSPAAGALLSSGTQTLTTVFTPTDTADYNTATAMVSITVNAAAGGNPPCAGPTVDTNLAVSDTEYGRVLIFRGPLCTGMDASVELGQASLTSSLPGNYEVDSASHLFSPMGVTFDSDGDLYAADPMDGRVVQFKPPFANDMDASLELGMPDFTSGWFTYTGNTMALQCGKNPPAMSVCMPQSVKLDGAGNVWVADTMDGRVLEFQPPITQAMNASLAIGHPDLSGTADCNGIYTDEYLIDNGPGPPATANAGEFCDPADLALDGSGNLWVADSGDHRVLEFTPPFSTGMSASLELGFSASVGMNSPSSSWFSQVDATNFAFPSALAFDAQGDLWVADGGFSRVLEFVPPFTSGMAASLVIGQQDFAWVGTTSQPTVNGLNEPGALAFDAHGDLIVADTDNNRVVIFVPPFSNGMNASVVLGARDMIGDLVNEPSGPCSPAGNCWSTNASTMVLPGGIVAF